MNFLLSVMFFSLLNENAIKSVLTVEIKIKITSCIVLSKSPLLLFMFAIK